MGNCTSCCDSDEAECTTLYVDEPVDVWYTPGVNGVPGTYVVIPRI